MATKQTEKEEKKRDMPILFFLGIGASVLLIWLLHRKGGGISAILNGILDDDGGAETKVSFEYGTEEGAWTQSPEIVASSETEFSLQLPNLIADATYYFRARAENCAGITFGETLSFQT